MLYFLTNRIIESAINGQSDSFLHNLTFKWLSILIHYPETFRDGDNYSFIDPFLGFEARRVQAV